MEGQWRWTRSGRARGRERCVWKAWSERTSLDWALWQETLDCSSQAQTLLLEEDGAVVCEMLEETETETRSSKGETDRQSEGGGSPSSF
jgi:hypothetical protein